MDNSEIEMIDECVDDSTELSCEINAEDNAGEKSELDLLRGELESLREELRAREEKEKLNSRMLAQLSEFEEYFPEVDIAQIPDEVWEKVKSGIPLSATYALHLRKSEIERKRVSDFNEKNRRMSAGSLTQGEGEKYFSPAEVKKMSPAQVKANYDDIVESMRHWN